MRTKNPTYISGDHLVARVRISDGKGGTTLKRFKQKVPDHITAPSERATWARGVVKNLKSEQARDITLDYLNKMRDLKRRTGCTIGDITAAALDPSQETRKSPADQRRMVNQLYRVLAIALDHWTTNEGGRPGVKLDADVPDRPRIDALPATVLNAETRNRYFRNALGVPTVNWMHIYEDAPGINSRINQCRDIFRGRTREFKLAHLTLPDISAFMKGRLKTSDALPEPVEAEEFKKVVDLFDGLKTARRDLWLCDLVIRQTGMRSLSSAMQLHRDWLVQLEDGHWLNVEGKTRYQIPITEELATEILKSDNYLFLPDASDADEAARKRNAALRSALLDEHTILLKTIIGSGSGGQVNHRLRDTVGSALYHGMSIEAAQEALGHADAKTTRKHYARRMDVSPIMKHELRAWTRVGGEWKESNVVPFKQAKVA